VAYQSRADRGNVNQWDCHRRASQAKLATAGKSVVVSRRRPAVWQQVSTALYVALADPIFPIWLYDNRIEEL
jgi:hypothetical protein